MSEKFALAPENNHIAPSYTDAAVHYQYMIAIPDKGKHASASNGDKVLPFSPAPYTERRFYDGPLHGFPFSHYFFSMVNGESDLSLPLFSPDLSNPVTSMRHFFLVFFMFGTSQS